MCQKIKYIVYFYNCTFDLIDVLLCFSLLCSAVIHEDQISAVELEGFITLRTGVTEIQYEDKILWTFGDEETLIAQIIKGAAPSFCDFEDGMFRDRLKINPQTGDLTLTNITARCTGLYQVQIHSRRRETEYIGYKVAIFGEWICFGDLYLP